MAMREKFGKLVLLEEGEVGGLGPEYRAAKLGPGGVEKIVTLLRLKPEVSSSAELARRLMDQTKLAAQLQSPNILRILGIGKVDQSYYVTWELLEGKSLRSVLERCRLESFPFSTDHALLVASKVASALEHAHVRRSETGERYFHGLLTSVNVLVSYEGEVRVKGFGYWPSGVRSVLPAEDLRYLAPEQAAGAGGDTRSDIYALGAVLLEALSGQPPEDGELLPRIASARIRSPTGEEEPIPPPLKEILKRALSTDPSARYGEVAEMRKAIDTLLFSGDFTPTTFNLAFFMHSLYREDIERDARTLKEQREASYTEFLQEEPPRPLPVPAARPAAAADPSKTEPVDPRILAGARAAEATAAPAVPPAPVAHAGGSPWVSSREPAGGLTFQRERPARRRNSTVLVGLAALALLAGAAAYLLLRPRLLSVPSPPPPTTLSPTARAALARVKELEDKLAALEREKAQAEMRAAEEARQKVVQQAAARGRTVDQAALQQAQEEARRRAKEEQERRQQEELRRLAEAKRAEEERLAEEKRRAEEAARAAAEAEAAARAAEASPTPPPTTLPPPTTTLPAIRPGTLVNLSDLGVTPPVVVHQPQLTYPPIALRQRVEGTVELNVFVDEKGVVSDVQIVRGAGGKAGLSEAAIDNVKRWRYRPATKEGVPVKVWLPVRVVFTLPK